MWEHIILFLLSGGICKCVHVADIFLVQCWSIVVSVLAAGLFYLHKEALYAFVSCFLCDEAL